MLSLNEALDVAVEALQDVSAGASSRVPIQLTYTLAELGITTALDTQVLAESIVTSLRRRNHYIDESPLLNLKPEWQVREVADLIMSFALPGDETFGEDVDLNVGDEGSAAALEEAKDGDFATELAGDDFAEHSALPGEEDFDET